MGGNSSFSLGSNISGGGYGLRAASQILFNSLFIFALVCKVLLNTYVLGTMLWALCTLPI